MADVVYNATKLDLLKGTIDYANDTIKVALVTDSYTPNQDTHAFFDDVTNEISGTGYTAGGETLANQAVSQDNTDNEGVFDADDQVWTGATFTTRAAVMYKDTGTPATSPLMFYFDFLSNKSPSATNFTIQWNAEGIANIT